MAHARRVAQVWTRGLRNISLTRTYLNHRPLPRLSLPYLRLHARRNAASLGYGGDERANDPTNINKEKEDINLMDKYARDPTSPGRSYYDIKNEYSAKSTDNTSGRGKKGDKKFKEKPLTETELQDSERDSLRTEQSPADNTNPLYQSQITEKQFAGMYTGGGTAASNAAEGLPPSPIFTAGERRARSDEPSGNRNADDWNDHSPERSEETEEAIRKERQAARIDDQVSGKSYEWKHEGKNEEKSQKSSESKAAQVGEDFLATASGMKDTAAQKLHDLKDAFMGKVDDISTTGIGKSARDVGHKVAEKASDLADRAKTTAQAAATGATVGAGAQKIADTLHKVKERVVETISNIKDTVSHAKDRGKVEEELKEKGGEAIQYAKEKASDAKEFAQGAKEKGKEYAQYAKEKASDVKDAATEKGREYVERGKAAVGQASEKVTGQEWRQSDDYSNTTLRGGKGNDPFNRPDQQNTG